MLNLLSDQRNANQNNFEIPSEWLKSKTPMIAYAGEDVRLGKQSSIFSGTENLCNHFGNECGSISGNWESTYLRIQQ